MSNNVEFTDVEKIMEAILHIRNTSKEGHLTSKETLHEVLNIEEEKLESLLDAVKSRTELIELKTISDDNNTEFFYSGTEMTDRYANILMSVNNKNYLKLIADTVRYESKTYPRPTRIDLFTVKPYNIKESDLLDLLSSLSENSEYADLKFTEASNGVIFIYSLKYMSADYAKSLAEWEEVLSKEMQ